MHTFCATDNASFTTCEQSVGVGSGFTTVSSSMIPPVNTAGNTNPDDNPFVYIRSKIFPEDETGVPFTTTTINQLTGSNILL